MSYCWTSLPSPQHLSPTFLYFSPQRSRVLSTFSFQHIRIFSLSSLQILLTLLLISMHTLVSHSISLRISTFFLRHQSHSYSASVRLFPFSLCSSYLAVSLSPLLFSISSSIFSHFHHSTFPLLLAPLPIMSVYSSRPFPLPTSVPRPLGLESC